MRATMAVRVMALMALLVGMATAGVKYVAVVETDVDAQSGASADINPAEVRQITAELRRQATENLPRDKYNVMTSETVQSMGGAVLEECAEENCVIALGSKIGADYIVRGTISKFQTKLTLTVEMYETENGTLVVTSEPVRSENIGELLDRGTVACGEMYRKFAGGKTQTPGRQKDTRKETANNQHDNATDADRNVDTKSYSNAIGLRLGVGGPSIGSMTVLIGELNYQKMLGRNRLEFGGLFEVSAGDNYSYGAVGFFQWHWGKGLNFYIGPGTGVGFYSYGAEKKSYEIYVDVGGQIGLGYNLNTVNVPLLLSLDMRPMVNLIHPNGGLYYKAGLGIRYTF